MIQVFRFKIVGILLVFIFALVSCKKSDIASSGINGQDGPAGTPGSVAFVSVVHAAPQTGSLQFAFNQSRANLDIFNFTDRVNYLNTFSGLRRFAVFQKGSSDTLVAKNILLQPGKNYSIFITGVPGKTDAVLLRDSSRAPGSDSVRIRFANMSPDAGSLDLFIGGNDKPLATNIQFKTATDFVSVKAANNLILEVRRSERGDIFSKTKPINLVSGNYYTIWSKGMGALSNGGPIGPEGPTGPGEQQSGLEIFWH